jgi:hypothetical protein
LSQIKRNSINCCDFCTVSNSWKERPLWILTPGTEKPSYATVCMYPYPLMIAIFIHFCNVITHSFLSCCSHLSSHSNATLFLVSLTIMQADICGPHIHIFHLNQTDCSFYCLLWFVLL